MNSVQLRLPSGPKISFEWLHPLVAVHHLEWFSVTHSLIIHFDQHLAIPTNNSGPTIPERAPKNASLLAISLPLIPVYPVTHKRRSLLHPASLPSASLHSPTSRERVTGTASALRAAWLSEQILMCLRSVLRSSSLWVFVPIELPVEDHPEVLGRVLSL